MWRRGGLRVTPPAADTPDVGGTGSGDEWRGALAAALALQLDWGVEDALADAPIDRTRPPADAPGPEPVRGPAARTAPAAAVAPLDPAAVTVTQRLAAAADSLDALRAAIAGFDHPLRETATSLVFADGVPGSPLMVIGEAPGSEEDRVGRPFVGPSGQLLDRMLASIGISRGADAYLANILPWRPPGNRTPTDTEIALFLPFLLRHVALARPRRLLILGGLPAKALLGGRDGISKLRGRWLQVTIEEDKTWPALATFHPAYLLRTPAAKRDAWADLLTLRRTLDTE